MIVNIYMQSPTYVPEGAWKQRHPSSNGHNWPPSCIPTVITGAGKNNQWVVKPLHER